MKRLCALALCFALIIPQALAVGTADWPAWGQEALDWAREVSISEAYLSAPGQTVTRADAAQLLYEAAGRPDVTGECPFSDVSGDAVAAVTWAASRFSQSRGSMDHLIMGVWIRTRSASSTAP